MILLLVMLAADILCIQNYGFHDGSLFITCWNLFFSGYMKCPSLDLNNYLARKWYSIIWEVWYVDQNKFTEAPNFSTAGFRWNPPATFIPFPIHSLTPCAWISCGLFPSEVSQKGWCSWWRQWCWTVSPLILIIIIIIIKVIKFPLD